MDVRIVAEGLAFPEGPVALPDGDLLVVEIAAGRLTRIRPDGSRTTVCETGGGPNGAAIGPDGRCYLCNNGGFRWIERDGRRLPGLPPRDYAGGWIEAVDLTSGEREVLYRACGEQRLSGPNDLVFDRDGGMWFTDHGRTHRRHRDRGSVYYAAPDGSFIREVVFPLDGPNGIGLSPDGGALYVAETFTARLWAFEIDGPGSVRKVEAAFFEPGRLVAGLGGYRHFDSLALDGEGTIYVATLPEGITAISPDGSAITTIPLPDDVTTNLCFGGPDGRTAFATLASTGRIASFRIEVAGLAPNFSRLGWATVA